MSKPVRHIKGPNLNQGPLYYVLQVQLSSKYGPIHLSEWYFHPEEAVSVFICLSCCPFQEHHGHYLLSFKIPLGGKLPLQGCDFPPMSSPSWVTFFRPPHRCFFFELKEISWLFWVRIKGCKELFIPSLLASHWGFLCWSCTLRGLHSSLTLL